MSASLLLDPPMTGKVLAIVPTRLEGTIVNPSGIASELGMNAEEAKRWNDFLKDGPPIMGCPFHFTKFANGQSLYLVWYQDERDSAPELHFVRPDERITSPMITFEVYARQAADQKGVENTKMWRKRLLEVVNDRSYKEDPNRGLTSRKIPLGHHQAARQEPISSKDPCSRSRFRKPPR